MTCPESAAAIGYINVMLGHGNHPTAAKLFPQIGELVLLAAAC